MSRRYLAVTAAALLAVLGAVVIVTYVNHADARARADEQLVPVLVVTKPVPAGTSAGALADDVSTQQVPKRLAATGTLSSLSSVAGKVANADLLPGEQLLAGRFTDPAVYRPAGAATVPDGDVEVSVSLDVQRAAGGVLKAGDQVGVQVVEQPNGASDVAPLKVAHAFHAVLVTRVLAPSAKTDPNGTYTITLAMTQPDAETVILGGTATKAVWLSLEKSGVGSASTGSTETTTAHITTSGGSK